MWSNDVELLDSDTMDLEVNPRPELFLLLEVEVVTFAAEWMLEVFGGDEIKMRSLNHGLLVSIDRDRLDVLRGSVGEMDGGPTAIGSETSI